MGNYIVRNGKNTNIKYDKWQRLYYTLKAKNFNPFMPSAHHPSKLDQFISKSMVFISVLRLFLTEIP